MIVIFAPHHPGSQWSLQPWPAHFQDCWSNHLLHWRQVRPLCQSPSVLLETFCWESHKEPVDNNYLVCVYVNLGWNVMSKKCSGNSESHNSPKRVRISLTNNITTYKTTRHWGKLTLLSKYHKYPAINPNTLFPHKPFIKLIQTVVTQQLHMPQGESLVSRIFKWLSFIIITPHILGLGCLCPK